MKKPLLLIPGLLCDQAAWKDQIASLSDVADAKVMLNGPCDSLGGLAESIIAQAPARFALAGHSMGGRIALEVARRIPERLLGIALLDTGYEALPSGTAGEREATGRYALLDLARSEGMAAMARAWLRGMIHPARLDDRELVDIIVGMFTRQTPDLYELQIRALLNRPDASGVLAQLPCRTLFVCGREDAWAPPSRHEAMASRVRQATLEVVADCGHMSTIERPHAVSAALRSWLHSIGMAA